jgi:hypothetical protein
MVGIFPVPISRVIVAASFGWAMAWDKMFVCAA